MAVWVPLKVNANVETPLALDVKNLNEFGELLVDAATILNPLSLLDISPSTPPVNDGLKFKYKLAFEDVTFNPVPLKTVLLPTPVANKVELKLADVPLKGPVKVPPVNGR